MVPIRRSAGTGTAAGRQQHHHAAAAWPANLVSASRPHWSSSTPSRQISPPATSTASGLQSSKVRCSAGSRRRHEDRGGQPEEHGHAAAPGRRDHVHVAVPRLCHHPPDRDQPHHGRGQEGDQRRGEQDDGVLAHRSAARCGLGVGRVRADQLADLGGDLGRAAPSASRIAVPISEAISFMSASAMPWVVTDGVPTRMPDAMDGRLRVVGDGVLVQHDAGGVAAGLGVRLRSPRSSCRSSSARWVSVPPVTGRMPSAARPSVSAWALAMTCRA